MRSARTLRPNPHNTVLVSLQRHCGILQNTRFGEGNTTLGILADLLQTVHLQVLFHLTPLAVDVRVDIAAVLQYTESQLADAELQFINRDVLPLGTLYSLRNGRSVEVGDGRGGDG